MRREQYDVVVVGLGIAGLSAGLRAAELGRSVAVLEKSPEADRGGQTGYSESFRVPSADADLEPYGYEFDVPDYTTEAFYRDIMARTSGKADEELARTVVESAGGTVEWLTEHGVEWDMEPLAVGYTAGRTWFDNEQLLDQLTGEIEIAGGEIYYETSAESFSFDGVAIDGVETVSGDERVFFDAGAVVLACGGYESSSEKRARYYGPGFDDMKVRGSGYNTGDALEAAIDQGAEAVGQWSGAHMAIIDANAPDVGGGANRVDGYQYGLVLNVDGERFLNEGEDARAHTYAKFGRRIFEQPDHLAYIVLDSDKQALARATGPTEPFEADTLAGLFKQLELDDETALETVERFNAACDPGAFDPDSLDGNAATDVDPPKSNWATPLDDPPYYAYPVTGGITFGFGGVAITPDAEVVDGRGHVIPGFYAAGNATGGLFYDNYPGGTGLTNAAVFGKTAAERADAYLDG
jgi:tricarballylate dehydrogenase